MGPALIRPMGDQVLPRFLIIEDGTTASERGWQRLIQAYAPCDMQTWEGLEPYKFSPSQLKLIIAHVAPAAKGVWPFFRALQARTIPIPVVAVLPESVDRELLNLVSQAADDFIFSPLRGEELDLRVGRVLGTSDGRTEGIRNKLVGELGLAQLVGQHPLFVNALEQAVLFSANHAPVLITGETGTGKELFAHAIHSLGDRRNHPFVPLDCGTLPDHLAENELFGHRRGAYTDAHRDQRGLAAMAESGTLFLDEIDALSAANQAKLLRLLQEGTYRALGADRVTQTNIRIIAATNRPVEDAVLQRQFRSDLYFRLNVLRLQLPPLRERRSDIALLARHFLENELVVGGDRKCFSAAALRKLESHSWPGNVRELLNVVRRASIGAPGRQILTEHIILPGGSLSSASVASMFPEALFEAGFRLAKERAIENFERAYVEGLLQRHAGNVTRAAREARKERRSFGRLIKKYSIGSESPEEMPLPWVGHG